MTAAAILNFKIFNFLTVGTFKRFKLYHCAKFRWRRSNHNRDIVIFRFYKMAADAFLDFRNFKFLTVGPYGQVGQTTLPRQISLKSAQTRSRYGNLSIFQDRAAVILAFKNFTFLTVGTVMRSKCFTMPNFVKVGPTAAEIWRFFYFSRWRPPPSWIFEISNF